MTFVKGEEILFLLSVEYPNGFNLILLQIIRYEQRV